VIALVQPLPDEVLLDSQTVDSLLEDRFEDSDFVHEVCEFPDHFRQIERLKIENEQLKQQVSYEKAKNSILAGEISTFRELARRVLYGDKDEESWDSRHEAFIRLVGGLLGVKSKEDLEVQNYQGHRIPRKRLDRLYLGRRKKK